MLDSISKIFGTDAYRRESVKYDAAGNLSAGERLLSRKVDGSKSWADKVGEAVEPADKDKVLYEMASADAQASSFLYDLMTGSVPSNVKVPKIEEMMNDFLSHRDFPFIWDPAIELVMKNYIMPQILVSSEIFRTIPYTGQKSQVNIRTIGPIEVEEVGDGEPYPEVGSSIMDKAYRIALDIKKYGVKLGMTRELRESDNWGVLGFLLTQIADGFVIHKEYACMNLLNKMGVTIFNNAAPSTGIEKRITEGRGIDGNPNGTMSLNDLMAMWAYGNSMGFNYSVLLMHPFAWQMFATNPELREIVIQGSNVQSALNSSRRQGAAAPGVTGPFGEMWGQKMSGLGGQSTNGYYSPNNALDPVYGKLGISPASTSLTPWGATFNIPPGNFWPGGLRVIVTPYIPWAQDSSSKKYITNLYFIDPERTGVILQGEGPTTEEWEDVEREIQYIKFKSRWGLAPVYQGRGVAVARNIVIDRSYVFENTNSVSLSAITAASTVGGVSWPS
jgi:hypothetical protein